MIKDEEMCVSFMNSKVREELKDIPAEGVVITDLLEDNEVIVVPMKEFLDWLYEK